MRTSLLVLTLAAALPFATGCADSSACSVSGTVTLDGQPLDDAVINFHPDDPNVAAVGGKIKDGQYRATMPAGGYTVKIRAARIVPGKMGPMGPLYEDYVPDRYNKQSTLHVEATPRGPNRLNFDLKAEK